MPRDYWVPFGPTAITVAADIAELTPAANKAIVARLDEVALQVSVSADENRRLRAIA